MEVDLQWKNFGHQHNSFIFDQISLKLADKVDIDEVSDKLENSTDWIINLNITSP